MKLMAGFQKLVERLFFRGKSSRASEALAFILMNLILMGGVFFVLLNTVVYDLTGTMYAAGFHLITPLDSIIPFEPAWAVLYLYAFYPLTALTLAWFALAERKKGYALAWALVLINLVADLVYLVFPVTTDVYRAELLAHPVVGNPLADAMYAHYAADPSFNCFPSLHAAISVICAYAWYRYARSRPNALTRSIAVFMALIAAGVILSTLFVKQHYVADELAGALLGWGAGVLVFRKLWEPKPAA